VDQPRPEGIEVWPPDVSSTARGERRRCRRRGSHARNEALIAVSEIAAMKHGAF